MLKTSTMYGIIHNDEPVLNREVRGEKFYTVDVEFREVTIPVLISEHCLDMVVKGKVAVTGSLMSDFVRHKLPTFYFYANKIEQVDIDVDLTNELNFSGLVTKVKEFVADDCGRDLLPLTIRDTSPIQTVSVLYLSARNRNARELKSREQGYNVTGTGYLKKYRDIYEIYVKTIEVV